MKRLSAVFALGLLLSSSFVHPQDATVPEVLPPDVRVIIDISGSMKQNDPNNLRRPALELLVQLFPEGSKAGVWTFGQWVNNLVPSKPVDERWRVAAADAATKINSVAMRTNIPEALRKATSDLNKLDPRYKVHLILLTDGMVDVSKSAAENTRARQMILDQLLPAIRAANITIHTVALSNNADQQLMERLAVETDGLASVAETADDLRRIFLQAFDAAAPAEQLPIKGNKFLVDASIDEFTALVFKKDPSETAVLISPTGERYQATDNNAELKWFTQDNYDLITVAAPQAGEWSIQADLEPDSRVTIVSNLSLQVSRLANSQFVGDRARLAAVLREQGDNIQSAQFLELVDVSVEVTRRSDDERWAFSLSERNAVPANGVFSTGLDMLNSAGVYDIKVQANGKTFQRQQTQTIEVRNDFAITIKSDSATEPPSHQATLLLHNPSVSTRSIAVSGSVTSPNGNVQRNPSIVKGDRRWQLSLPVSEESGYYLVSLEATGNYKNGEPFAFNSAEEIEHVVAGKPLPKPVIPAPLPMPKPTPVAAEPEPAAPEPAPEPEPAHEPEPASASEPAVIAEPEEGMNLKKTGMYVGIGIGNILILILGYFAYRMITGGGSQSAVLTDDDDQPEAMDDMEPELDEELDVEPDSGVAQTAAVAIDDLADDLEDEPIEELAESLEDDMDLSDLDEAPVEVDDVIADDLDLAEEDEPLKQTTDEPAVSDADDLAADLDDILDLPDDAIDIDAGGDEQK